MSSKRAIRRRQCGKKQRFATEQAAVQAIRSLIARKGPQGGWLTPYRCAFCGGFHFGHAPAQVRRHMGR